MPVLRRRFAVWCKGYFIYGYAHIKDRRLAACDYGIMLVFALVAARFGATANAVPPIEITGIVSVPNVISDAMCDDLADRIITLTNGTFVDNLAKGVLPLKRSEVQVLVGRGLLGAQASAVYAADAKLGIKRNWNIPVRVNNNPTFKAHTDVPSNGAQNKGTRLLYLADASSALVFPSENTTVEIKRGTFVAFPPDTVHSVAGQGRRIHLGPYFDLPATHPKLVSVPNAIPDAMCDRLAKRVVALTADTFVGNSSNATLDLEQEEVEALASRGILGAHAAELYAADVKRGVFGKWRVPVRIDDNSDFEMHVDKNGNATADSRLLYLADAPGSLFFPLAGTFMQVRRGTFITFPYGTPHGVVDSGRRIAIGPFHEIDIETSRSRRDGGNIGYIFPNANNGHANSLLYSGGHTPLFATLLYYPSDSSPNASGTVKTFDAALANMYYSAKTRLHYYFAQNETNTSLGTSYDFLDAQTRRSETLLHHRNAVLKRIILKGGLPTNDNVCQIPGESLGYMADSAYNGAIILPGTGGMMSSDMVHMAQVNYVVADDSEASELPSVSTPVSAIAPAACEKSGTDALAAQGCTVPSFDNSRLNQDADGVLFGPLDKTMKVNVAGAEWCVWYPQPDHTVSIDISKVNMLAGVQSISIYSDPDLVDNCVDAISDYNGCTRLADLGEITGSSDGSEVHTFDNVAAILFTSGGSKGGPHLNAIDARFNIRVYSNNSAQAEISPNKECRLSCERRCVDCIKSTLIATKTIPADYTALFTARIDLFCRLTVPCARYCNPAPSTSFSLRAIYGSAKDPAELVERLSSMSLSVFPEYDVSARHSSVYGTLDVPQKNDWSECETAQKGVCYLSVTNDDDDNGSANCSTNVISSECDGDATCDKHQLYCPPSDAMTIDNTNTDTGSACGPTIDEWGQQLGMTLDSSNSTVQFTLQKFDAPKVCVWEVEEGFTASISLSDVVLGSETTLSFFSKGLGPTKTCTLESRKLCLLPDKGVFSGVYDFFSNTYDDSSASPPIPIRIDGVSTVMLRFTGNNNVVATRPVNAGFTMTVNDYSSTSTFPTCGVAYGAPDTDSSPGGPATDVE